MNVTKKNGESHVLDIEKIHAVVRYACEGLNVSESEVEVNASIMFFDGIETSQIHSALIKSAAELISEDYPDYTFVAARLVLQTTRKEVNDGSIHYGTLENYIRQGVAEQRLTADLLDGFDFIALDDAIVPKRDLLFTYLSMTTIADRYLIRKQPKRGQQSGDLIEMPQHMFMRVAMGLALNEKTDRTGWAIQFYNLLSSLEFLSSTPTLFNSGTNHAQMSSCYLNQVQDKISADKGENQHASIFGLFEECANLSKWAGGIGTDWTNVRPAGDLIVGTNGKSSGVVPYLKIFNDVAVAVNQGGKRNGAFAAYLEPWHGDFMRFCDLKKNAGEERLRAREIFTAVWTNDIFMERVRDDGQWSFFSPKDCPDLHTLYGDEFRVAYEGYEAAGVALSTMPAKEVWRHWLAAMWESGGPWVTFKDEANRRNPQSHVGTVNNSNLCTEITLNTSADETAVCNLGSVNASKIRNLADLERIVPVAIRMLDNVIDLNFYPSGRARRSNMQHRPIGLGVMGWTEYVVRSGVDWESNAHMELTNQFFEKWSYEAIKASVNLSIERGAYPSFNGSKWSQGILPIDTARELPFLKGEPQLDWHSLREAVKAYGMRNSNVMAIAPTATIANIAGTTPSIEPIFERSYTKRNHSGLFKVVDPSLRYGHPSLCKESFEINQTWLIKAGAVRQQWIDQAQSLNLFAKDGTKGADLNNWYFLAWELGLKTTYYLRRQIESTQEEGASVKGVIESVVVSATEEELLAQVPEGVMCSIDNPDCESCQ